MRAISLKPLANQYFEFQLNGSRYKVTLNSRNGKTYLSYQVNNKQKLLNRICLNRVLINDVFMFEDTQGNEDPYYVGFGDRFKLRLLQ